MAVDGDIEKSELLHGSKRYWERSNDRLGYQRFWAKHCSERLQSTRRALDIALTSKVSLNIHHQARIHSRIWAECANASLNKLLPDDSPKLGYWLGNMAHYLHMSAQTQSYGDPEHVIARAKAYLAWAAANGEETAAERLAEITAQEPKPAASNDAGAIKMVADGMLLESRENGARFSKLYDKKTLLLTGNVLRIESDYLSLDTAPHEKDRDRRGLWHSIRCMVPSSGQDKLMELKKGQRVTVRGVLGNDVLNVWILADCAVVASH